MSPRREGTLVPDVQPRTYYDQPVLKEPVWKWEIPAYLFTGGIAAGAALIAAAGDLSGGAVLPARMERVALAATVVSGALLTADLGRPERAHHMLRVFKPSSPMNVGAWLLGTFAGSVASAVLADAVAGGATVRITRLGAAAIAPAIACYTAVLIGDTAIPVWHDSHVELPFVFAGGAAASAAGLALLVAPADEQAGVRAFLVGGAALELVAFRLMERRLDRSVVGRALHARRSATLGRIAKLTTSAGAVLAVAGRRRRALAVAGGVLVLAGALTERFTIFEAGRASARDPAAVVAPQRERLDARATEQVTKQVAIS